MLDYTNKSFVRSFSYSDLKKDRNYETTKIINGRKYTKHGKYCSSTMVCHCFKVYDSSVKQFKYLYLAGIARQHPNDITIKYSDGIQIASENAMIKPVIKFISDYPMPFENVELMMELYVNSLKPEFIKTRSEINNEKR